MQSPLPDSSALEAGIIEDSRPSRLSRVQDNVRNLLRISLSHPSTIIIPSPSQGRAHMDEGYESSTTSPITRERPPVHRRPEVLPSPTHFLPATTYAPREMLPTPPPSPQRPYAPIARAADSSPIASDGEGMTPTSQTGLLSPPLQQLSYHPRPLDHPDLSNASLAPFQQHEQQVASQQHHAGRETRHRGSGKKGMEKQRAQRKRQARMVASQQCLCGVTGLLLAAVVATYLSLAITASSPLTATFHILFVLGVLLATVVFAHSLVRMCLLHRGLAGSTHFFMVRQHGKSGAVGRKRGQGNKLSHSQRHHHSPERSRRVPQQQPRRGDSERHQQDSADNRSGGSMTVDSQPSSNAEFLPPTPIQVHVASDDLASRQPPPTDRDVGRQTSTPDAWGRPVPEVSNPPPAYGRWRGSVRANPELLHWQPIPSPVSPGSDHILPSPTYEEAMAAGNDSVVGARTGPPSYATKDMNGSPSRICGQDLAQAQVENRRPEMIEIAGVGLAV